MTDKGISDSFILHPQLILEELCETISKNIFGFPIKIFLSHQADGIPPSKHLV